MHYTVPSLALLALIAAAAPSDNPWKDAGVVDPWGEFGNTQKRQPNPWKDAGVLDPWGEYGNEQTKRDLEHLTERQINDGVGIASRTPLSRSMLKEIVKRTSIGEFKNYLPGCNKKKGGDDPSLLGTPKPPYAVNQGVKIPKEGNDDQCTDGHYGDHCWTEYFLVEAAIEYMSWQPSGGAINCDGTDTCSSAETNIKQSCSTLGSTTTNGFDWKIIDAAGKVKIPLLKNGEAEISTGFSFKHEKTTYDLKQTCSTYQSSQTCSWKPANTPGADNCHQVWFADRVLHFWGQAQRTCNKCTSDGTVQQNTGDGKVCVRGQKQFDIVLPINKLVHCNGKCNQADPGLSIPPNTQRAPYEQPADWNSLHLRTKEDPNQ
ncbi:MAG: hypothetical protein Q9160_009247 [Pyrenula sp. 1 TL-2023]